MNIFQSLRNYFTGRKSATCVFVKLNQYLRTCQGREVKVSGYHYIVETSDNKFFEHIHYQWVRDYYSGWIKRDFYKWMDVGNKITFRPKDWCRCDPPNQRKIK